MREPALRAAFGTPTAARFATARALLLAALCASLFTLAFPARAPAADAPGRGVRTLYLVRHGAYEERDTTDEDTGRHLVPLGREQAKRVGARLAALPVRFDALHASTMSRARETAAIIAPALHLDPRPARDLRECTPPSRSENVMRDLAPGEADSCGARIDRAFARFFRPSPDRDSAEVLVCHGNVIRWIVCRALGVDPAAWLGMAVIHTGITIVQVRPDGSMKLVCFNDAGHLPPAMQTQRGTERLTARRPAPR
jgi:serine/threonine-protein phosphatase PGAM5